MTNSKKTINKHQKNEDLFYQIFDFNPIGIFISDLETTKIEYVNELFLQIFGYTKAEVIGKTINQLDFIDNETTEKVILLLKQKGVSKNIELLARKKTGETFWILASVKVITHNNEKLSITSFTNIEVQKKAQTDFVIANKELIYENSEKEKRAAELVIANKEFVFQNSEKEKRAAELVIANKELVFQNSEKEKRANELVISKKSILDYKSAIDKSNIIAVTDIMGVITYANDHFCKISKYTKEELIGKDHRIVNSGYHPKEFFSDVWKTISNGSVWKGEIKNKAKDGKIYWVDTTIITFINEQGKPYKYLSIRSDVTKRKQAEEKINNLNKELEGKVKSRTMNLTNSLNREKELNEIKTRFVSFASHEFRTPLSSILSSNSLLEMYNKHEHEELRSKHINRIASAVKNLTDILDDFLSFGELEQGIKEVEISIFNLPEFIATVVEELDGNIKKKKQQIIYQHNGEPIIKQSSKILRNILLNLLTNACKYSPEEKEILVTSSINNNNVFVSIKDYGIGIPEEDQKKIFSQFFRAGNVQNIQGTGLGLAIVKSYVELIKGNIEFISKAGEGTTFTIEFPLLTSHEYHH